MFYVLNKNYDFFFTSLYKGAFGMGFVLFDINQSFGTRFRIHNSDFLGKKIDSC